MCVSVAKGPDSLLGPSGRAFFSSSKSSRSVKTPNPRMEESFSLEETTREKNRELVETSWAIFSNNHVGYYRMSICSNLHPTVMQM